MNCYYNTIKKDKWKWPKTAIFYIEICKDKAVNTTISVHGQGQLQKFEQLSAENS